MPLSVFTSHPTLRSKFLNVFFKAAQQKSMSSLPVRRRHNTGSRVSPDAHHLTRPNNRPPPPRRQESLPEKLLSALLQTTPIAILTLLLIITTYTLQAVPFSSLHSKNRAPASKSTDDGLPPTLNELLAQVADALEAHSVRFWLTPGTGLLPTREARCVGRLAEWREGVDIGVSESDVQAVIEAQTDLQVRGILAVESHYGIRLYPITGFQDDRYDYRTPFIDILYFQQRNDHIMNSCCDCEPISFSACTKKTCGCLVCAMRNADLFPLQYVSIEAVRRKMPVPNAVHTVLLPRHVPGLHPALHEHVEYSDGE